MIVGIHKDNQDGQVSYNTRTKALDVNFPDEDVAKEITSYLSRRRKYRIPESNVIDDYREEVANPKDSLMYMELALCTLWAKTGVTVNWETQRR